MGERKKRRIVNNACISDGSRPSARFFEEIHRKNDPVKPPSRKAPGPPAGRPANPPPFAAEATPPPDPSTTNDTFPAAPRAFGPAGQFFIASGLPLHASYTFDQFIEGDCNQFARSAALAIAKQPRQTAFNPLLIYGGVGLGKTHLVQAIGNHVQRHSDYNVLYTSSDHFTSDYMQSLRTNRSTEFVAFYSDIDLLIIDDVQFFSNQTETQEGLFHIFNLLHQTGKQIVFSTDRAPQEIPGVADRLLSRFQGGLVADLQQPELETRIAILNRKANDQDIDIPYEFIEFIARHIKKNIRELESALIRLLAHATLHRREIDMPLIREALGDMTPDTQAKPTVEAIRRIACEYFGVEEDLVLGRSRKREIVQARHAGMYFSKKLTGHSLATIGRYFGGKDHATVIHACRCVENLKETDANFRETLKRIRREIEAELPVRPF